jgi:hypothetical protein
VVHISDERVVLERVTYFQSWEYPENRIFLAQVSSLEMAGQARKNQRRERLKWALGAPRLRSEISTHEKNDQENYQNRSCQTVT